MNREKFAKLTKELITMLARSTDISPRVQRMHFSNISKAKEKKIPVNRIEVSLSRTEG